MNYLLAIVLLLLVFKYTTEGKKRTKRKSEATETKHTISVANNNNYLSLSNGLQLHISDGPSYNQLKSWVKEIDSNYGSVTHFDAVSREREVVSKINNGIWNSQTYHEYQRIAAGTGNVDSAKLLISYGVGQSLHEINISKSFLSKIFKTISQCDLNSFEKLSLHADFSYDIMSSDGTTLLIAASYYGCFPIVSSILTNNDDIDVDFASLNGMNALLVACSNGHSKIAEILVLQGHANVNYKHKFIGTTALHMAAELNHAHVITSLCVTLSADVSMAVTHVSIGGNPLHTAADCGASEDTIIALIRDCKIDSSLLLNGDTTPLYLAVQGGHMRTVHALLTGGADPSFAMPNTYILNNKQNKQIISNNKIFKDRNNNYISPINSEAGNGAEAIHAAAEYGHLEIFKYLLNFNADVNTRSIGVSPLHLAVQYNRENIVNYLLTETVTSGLGVQVDLPSLIDGSTPLFVAVGLGHTHLVQALLKANASLTIPENSQGLFPLLHAVLRGKYPTVSLLLRAGAPINQRSEVLQISSLSIAASRGDLKMVKLLLKHDANVCLRDRNNETVFHFIVSSHKAYDDKNNGDGVIDVLRTVLTAYKNMHSTTCTTISEQANNNINNINNNVCLNLLHQKSSVSNLTAISLAVRKGYTSLVEIFLTFDSTPESIDVHVLVCVLYHAIDTNHLQIVKLIFSNEKTVNNNLLNINDELNLKEQELQLQLYVAFTLTPLLLAIERNAYAIVHYLLVEADPPADPNKGVSGTAPGIFQQPLLLTVVRGSRTSASIVKLLLEAGANCDITVAIATTATSSYVYETLIEISRRKRDFDTLQILSNHKSCN